MATVQGPGGVADARAWLVAKVRAYRAFGFFQSKEDRGRVTGDEPGFRHVPIGLPLAAYGRMDDAQVADVILRRHEAEWGQPFDPEEDDAAVRVAEHDAWRMARIDAECVAHGEDAYVDVLLALARISRGGFRPEDVRESWDAPEDGPVRVSFTLEGEPREIALDVSGDYLDDRVVDDVNMMLVGQGWRFERVETGDQSMLLVALSPRERRALEEEHGWRFASAPPHPGASFDAPGNAAAAPRTSGWPRWWPFGRGRR